jgi:hypothetical protein
MTLSELKSFTIDLIKQYPQHKGQLTEYYYLAESEVEEGGSIQHECELAERDMIDLVKH